MTLILFFSMSHYVDTFFTISQLNKSDDLLRNKNRPNFERHLTSFESERETQTAAPFVVQDFYAILVHNSQNFTHSFMCNKVFDLGQ